MNKIFNSQILGHSFFFLSSYFHSTYLTEFHPNIFYASNCFTDYFILCLWNKITHIYVHIHTLKNLFHFLWSYMSPKIENLSGIDGSRFHGRSLQRTVRCGDRLRCIQDSTPWEPPGELEDSGRRVRSCRSRAAFKLLNFIDVLSSFL